MRPLPDRRASPSADLAPPSHPTPTPPPTPPLAAAEAGLREPEPEGWTQLTDPFGGTFYFNAATNASAHEHPLDSRYRSLVLEARSASLGTAVTDAADSRQPTAREARERRAVTPRAVARPASVPPLSIPPLPPPPAAASGHSERTRPTARAEATTDVTARSAGGATARSAGGVTVSLDSARADGAAEGAASAHASDSIDQVDLAIRRANAVQPPLQPPFQPP